VGEFGTILHTTNGGKTWNVSHGGDTRDFTVGPSLWTVFSDLQHALVTGLNDEALTTADGGKTWKALKVPEAVATYAVAVTAGRFLTGGEGVRLVGMDAAGK
jgi:photosystem II stability/assembly factor-like uncharacterized protein